MVKRFILFYPLNDLKQLPFLYFSLRFKSGTASRSRNAELEILATLKPAATRSTQCFSN